MKVKRMGITEIVIRIWLFSAKKIKSSEYFSKQPIKLIVELIIAAHIFHICFYLLGLTFCGNLKLTQRNKEIFQRPKRN